MIKMREIRNDAKYCLCYPVAFAYNITSDVFQILIYFQNNNVKFVFIKHNNLVDMNVLEPMY